MHPKQVCFRVFGYPLTVVGAFLVLGAPSSADSQPVDQPLTQSGRVIVSDDGQGNFAPIDIAFPQEFGNTPTVTAKCGPTTKSSITRPRISNWTARLFESSEQERLGPEPVLSMVMIADTSSK